MQSALATHMHVATTFWRMPRTPKKPKKPKPKLLTHYVWDYCVRDGVATQDQLAELIGASQTTVGRMLNYEVGISPANLAALARVFNLPDPLLIYAHPTVANIVLLSRGLPQRDLNEVLALLHAKAENARSEKP